MIDLGNCIYDYAHSFFEKVISVCPSPQRTVLPPSVASRKSKKFEFSAIFVLNCSKKKSWEFFSQFLIFFFSLTFLLASSSSILRKIDSELKSMDSVLGHYIILSIWPPPSHPLPTLFSGQFFNHRQQVGKTQKFKFSTGHWKSILPQFLKIKNAVMFFSQFLIVFFCTRFPSGHFLHPWQPIGETQNLIFQQVTEN